VSNTDLLFMKDAMAGLQTDPQAIERVLAIRAAAALKKIDEHNAIVEAFAGMPKNDLGVGMTGTLYKVDRPKYSMRFNTPEARASFVSGLTGMPYETALAQVQDQDKDPAMKAGTAPGKADKSYEDRVRERMKALDLDYIPPPKGK
jgi:hypothetical protein